MVIWQRVLTARRATFHGSKLKFSFQWGDLKIQPMNLWLTYVLTIGHESLTLIDHSCISKSRLPARWNVRYGAPVPHTWYHLPHSGGALDTFCHAIFDAPVCAPAAFTPQVIARQIFWTPLTYYAIAKYRLKAITMFFFKKKLC